MLFLVVDMQQIDALGADTLNSTRLYRTGLFHLTFAFVVCAVALDFLVPGVNFNIGNALLIVVLGALAVYSLGANGDGIHQVRLLAHDWMYILSIGVMLGSVAWSVSPSASFAAAMPLLVVWLASIGLSSVTAEDAVRVVVIVAVVTAILSLIAIPVLGELAFQPHSTTGQPELRGIFRHQLRLGSFMMLAIGLLVVAVANGDLRRIFGRSRFLFPLCMFLLLFLLFLSRTRLYVAAGVFAIVLTLLLSRRGSKKWIALGLGSTAVLVMISSISSLMTKLEAAGFDTGLTGRTRTWSRALGAITEDRQLLGHGFGTFELSMFDSLFPGEYRPIHAHSSFVQAYFETGVVGLSVLILLILAQVIAAWRFSVRCNRFSYSLFLVLYTAIGSATGLNYAGSLSAMFCTMLLFLAIESRVKLTGAPHDRSAARLRSA